MSENKECLFYIDHNPPEYSGTWGGAIHKGACKLNSTDCKDTDGCFIKILYNKLKIKEQECKELNSDNRHFVNQITSLELLTDKYEIALDTIKNIVTDDDSLIQDYETAYDLAIDILNIIDEAKEQ